MSIYQPTDNIIVPGNWPWGYDSLSLLLSKYALHFDGFDDYVETGWGLGFSGSITVEAWIFLEPTGDFQNIFSSYNGNRYHFIVRSFHDSTFQVVRYNGNQQGIVELEDSSLFGRWFHLASSYDHESGDLKLYIDGSFVVADNNATIIANDGNYHLGSSPENPMFDNMMKGWMYEFRVWNTVRSETEIQRHMYRQANNASQDLFLYYPFTEGEGATLHDASGNGHDGTIHGATWTVRE